MPAWNALVYGKKHWLLLPPNQAIFSEKQPLEFVKENYPSMRNSSNPPYECVQEAGDIVVVPSGWSHLVLNLQTSIGYALEISDSPKPKEGYESLFMLLTP